MGLHPILGLLALLLSAGGALAQGGAEPVFPAARDNATLRRWLAEQTDLRPAQVVAVSGLALSAVTQVRQEHGVRVLTLRAQALDPQIYRRVGYLAWESKVNVDCRARLVKVGATEAFAHRTTRDEHDTVRPADGSWRVPPPGSQLESAWRAVCDPDFVHPLAAEASPQSIDAVLAGRTTAPVAEVNPPRSPSSAPVRLSVTASPPPRSPRTETAAPKVRPPPRATRPQAPMDRAILLIAQLGASPNRHDAEVDLKKRTAGNLPAELRAVVQPAHVRGAAVYRQFVTGFTSQADARRYCAKLARHNQPCFVRSEYRRP